MKGWETPFSLDLLNSGKRFVVLCETADDSIAFINTLIERGIMQHYGEPVDQHFIDQLMCMYDLCNWSYRFEPDGSLGGHARAEHYDTYYTRLPRFTFTGIGLPDFDLPDAQSAIALLFGGDESK